MAAESTSVMDAWDVREVTTQMVVAMVAVYAVSFVAMWVDSSRKRIPSNSSNLWCQSPLLRSEWLSDVVGAGNVHLKLEPMQPSGSMMIRALSMFLRKRKTDNKLLDTFVTSSLSDGAWAMAHCAKELGGKGMVIVDETERADPMVTDLQTAYGATVECRGWTADDAEAYARSVAAGSVKVEYVPMSDDRVMALSYQSITTELNTQLSAQPDCIVFPVEGDGNLLLGLMAGLSSIGWTRGTKLVAVQSRKSVIRYGAVKTGSLSRPDGGNDVGHRPQGKTAMNWMADLESTGNAVESFVVQEDDAMNTATLFGQREKVMINAEAASVVTAVMENKEFFQKFENTVLIISSGNRPHFDENMLKKAQKAGTFDDHGLCPTSNPHTALDHDHLEFYDSAEEEM